MSTKVNAGIYLFNTSIIEKGIIQAIPSFLEKDILPLLAKSEILYCVTIDGYWMDIGMPHNYLTGTQLLLQHINEK